MKGQKTGGRTSGTPNKVTGDLREVLKDVMENEIRHLPERLDAMDDKDRVQVVVRLLPFILPKSVWLWSQDHKFDDLPLWK